MIPQHLGVLNLSFNRLRKLPSALGGAPVLQQMYLANNQLDSLPDSYAQVWPHTCSHTLVFTHVFHVART